MRPTAADTVGGRYPSNIRQALKAKLALENGTIFSGEAFGAPGEVSGEVVFNTSMSGYQEIYTDPSYSGQIVTLTYPLIGNYGTTDEDLESARPQVAGVIVREYTPQHSNFRSQAPLGQWLERHGITGLQGIDTRMLTRMIRTEGAMRGVLSSIDLDEKRLLAKVQKVPSMNGLDLATRVTCASSYTWDKSDETPFALATPGLPDGQRRFRVVAYDYGIKRNILRRLVAFGCAVTVVPAGFPATDVLAMQPDGVFLSNGPGDPAPVRVAIDNIRMLLGRVPIFGICLGHQLLALALSGKTYKLKFGHRGGNHPVKNLSTQAVEITSQNHGFAVDPDSLDHQAIEITHVNLNDGTNEGIRHRSLPAFSVQYHPEASPGPHDSDYLFRAFITMMESVAAVPAGR
ncbi:MAG: carbamoyl phosphate synthase small subunit [Bacteroidetes bacterium]|jgi:carbamoyl-phosphate synthase small subunit|nr:carbamoyl phosphate synthase small subunit [Bacteroidota bacterium]